MEMKMRPQSIRQYLDNCVLYWRSRESEGNEHAQYYIDAYQSVRMFIFDELLPSNDEIEEANVANQETDISLK